MPHDRRIRFALQLRDAPSGAEWAELCRRAEETGFATISMPDHFGAQLAPIPALAAAASATSTATIGMFVLANDFRSPVMVAKEAATLDVLSGGRLELGLGAGWLEAEYVQAGIDFADGATRLERLAEAVAILKALFRGGPVVHHGTHYRVDGLELFPRPVRAAGIPLVLGGGGNMMLALAAREADVVSITPASAGRTDAGLMGRRATFGTIASKVDLIHAAAGPRFDDLELNVRITTVVVTDDADGVASDLAPDQGLSPDELLASPFVLVGTAGEIGDRLLRLRDTLGISYFTVSQTAAGDLAPVVERLAGT